MRRGALGRAAAPVGVIAGVLQIAAGYPTLLGPVLMSVAQAAFVAWLGLVGVRLLRVQA